VNLQTFNPKQRPLEYIVPEGSLVIPADTDGAIAVGATGWLSDTLEPFSSWGPTADGRRKPDISAPDFVSTVSYGPFAFPGTSAAAPHVAGAIALMKSRFGLFSTAQIVDILGQRAIPKGEPNQYGVGRLDVIGR
jgi:subtilisin family serine protease